MNGRWTWRRDLPVVSLVAALVVILYARAAGFPIYGGDDAVVITGNARLAGGLSFTNVRWALTTFYYGSWFPLTWIWLLGVSQLFGHGAAALHLSNVLLHALASAGLYAMLLETTGAWRRSALAAALFAAHPLNVEAVAWVTQVSTTLAGFFGFLALRAHARYVRGPSPGRYAATTALAACALMAKQTWMVLPVALLLLDFWPLGRWRRGPRWRLLLEKTPLFALAATATLLKVAAERSVTTADAALHLFPLGARLANAAIATLLYARKMLWPVDLAPLYPHHGAASAGAQVAAAAALLALVCTAAIALRRRRPAIAAGWAWILLSLVPVIGFRQIGWTGMADRYAYVPLLGMAWILVWGSAGAPRSSRRAGLAAGAAAVAALAALVALCARQVGFWRDDEANLRRAVAVSPGYWLPRTLLGAQLLSFGRVDEGVRQLQAAIEREPHEPIALTLLGQVAADRGRDAEALAYLEAAAQAGSRHVETYATLGNVLLRRGRLAEAREAFRRALEIRPDHGEARARLAQLRGLGR